MPRWKKVSLLVAGGLVVTGAVLMVVDPGGATAPAGTGTGSGALQSSFIEGQPGSGTSGTATAQEPAAKGIFRLGFSFIAGFCLGAFVRAMVKIASIAIGFWIAMTLVLSYFDLVAVQWDQIQSLWDSFAANVEHEWQNFQDFITGSLPAAGLVATGFFVGVKRH